MGKSRPKAEPPRPVPVVVPKPEPEPEAVLVSEPDANPAPPPEDTMEVDGAVTLLDTGGAVEEDFVLREIDVYFNPKPFEDDTQLYIMQYSLRPCWCPYELNEICEEVRVKPLSSEVEVDLSINTQSENYDQEAPLRLTKQTLSSSKAVDVTNYAVGVLKGNLVHLNLIDAVVQM
jgi:DNA-directed RNA polymerase III subunit RPC5